MKTKTHNYLRWLIFRDMPTVVDIENESFSNPWTKKKFVRCMSNCNVIGMVAEVNNEVVGYMIYEIMPKEITLLSFAVHPKHRRSGVGRTLIERLIYKLDKGRRNRILAAVRERNLEAQLFLRNMGFLCTQVLTDYYENVTEDAYMMEYFISDN